MSRLCHRKIVWCNKGIGLLYTIEPSEKGIAVLYSIVSRLTHASVDCLAVKK